MLSCLMWVDLNCDAKLVQQLGWRDQSRLRTAILNIDYILIAPGRPHLGERAAWLEVASIQIDFVACVDADRERIFAIRIGQGAGDLLTLIVEQIDFDIGDTALAAILNTVSIGIEPDAVAKCH